MSKSASAPVKARRQGVPCPEKVPFRSLIEALDELQRRFKQPRSRVRRPYKCVICNCWHFTSQKSNYVPAEPFPVRGGHWRVVVDGRAVWSTPDADVAWRKARELHGNVVAVEDTRRKAIQLEKTKRESDIRQERNIR